MNPLTGTGRKNVFKKLLMVPLLFWMSGCVYLVVGGVGALGGYIVSPDTVEGITEIDDITLWDTSIEILSIMGVIQEEYEEGGVIVAKVNNARVTVTITPLAQSTTKFTVKARKSFFPHVSVAQDVYVKVMSHLEQ